MALTWIVPVYNPHERVCFRLLTQNLAKLSCFLQMVGSAVLGAATGTGLALVVAMTIVIYRYYKQKRYGKEWGNLDRGAKTKGGYSVLQKVSEINFYIKDEHTSHNENKNGSY